MKLDFVFFFNSTLLGVGLAMDAVSVSLANGFHEPKMKRGRMVLIAGIFALFQAIMPMTGWFCVHTVAQLFKEFQKLIPWIALILLLFIGGKMLIEGIQNKESEIEGNGIGLVALLIQGYATSIDALSVGFTIANYSLFQAILAALIIAAVTFVLCYIAIILGKKFGTKFANKATIIGGLILIFIGVEIFVTGIF